MGLVCAWIGIGDVSLHIVLYTIKKIAVGVKEQTLPRRLGHTGCISI